MIDIIKLIAPAYILIAVGYGVVKSGYLAQESVPHLNQFALKLCVPVLIFLALAKPGGLDALNWSFVFRYVFAAFSLMFIGYWLMRKQFSCPHGRAVVLAMGMVSSNSIFLGLPIVILVMGDDAIQVFAWILIAENMLLVPISLMIANMGTPQEGSPKRSLKTVLSSTVGNPITVGLLLGLAVSMTGIDLGIVLTKTFKMITAAAPVLTLTLVGGIMARSQLTRLDAPTIIISFTKLILHPIFAWIALSGFGGLGDDFVKTGVLFAAMPMFSLFVVFAGQHQAELTAARALILSTAASAVTVSLLIAYIY